MTLYESIILWIIFTFLGIQIVELILIIAVATTVTILIWLPKSFYVIFDLGRYLPLLKRKSKSAESSNIGEYFDEKVYHIFKDNLFIAVSLFVTLIFLFNTLPSIFVEPSTNLLLQNITIQIFDQSLPIQVSQSRLSTADVAFNLTLYVIPAFLLSLRLLANPGKVSKLFNSPNISGEERTVKVRYFKDQIISLYFGFVATTIAIFYFAICFTAMKYSPIGVLMVVLSFKPDYTYIAVLFFIIVEIISILILTIFGEKYLERSDPIDKK